VWIGSDSAPNTDPHNLKRAQMPLKSRIHDPNRACALRILIPPPPHSSWLKKPTTSIPGFSQVLAWTLNMQLRACTCALCTFNLTSLDIQSIVVTSYTIEIFRSTSLYKLPIPSLRYKALFCQLYAQLTTIIQKSRLDNVGRGRTRPCSPARISGLSNM
jgi:hypothetical protein